MLQVRVILIIEHSVLYRCILKHIIEIDSINVQSLDVQWRCSIVCVVVQNKRRVNVKPKLFYLKEI